MNEMFKAYIGEMFGPPGLAVDVVGPLTLTARKYNA